MSSPDQVNLPTDYRIVSFLIQTHSHEKPINIVQHVADIEIYENMKKGNISEAKKLQTKANIIILYAVKKAGYSFIKMGLNWMDLDSGYVRRPFTSFIDKEIEKEIKKDLKNLSLENDLKGIKFLDAL